MMLMLSVAAANCLPTAAWASFIDDYLLAHHYCGGFSGPAPYLNGSPTPLGREAKDWTDTDLAHLHEALVACRAAAARVGQNPDLSDLEQSIPEIVATARARQKQVSAERDAADRLETAKRGADAKMVHDERTHAEADLQKANQERAEALKLTDEVVARDEALIAAAHARRDAAVARQKAAAIAAQLKDAEAEAARIESAKPSPMVPAQKDAAVPPTDAAKPQADAKLPTDSPAQPEPAPTDSDVRTVTVNDLQVEGLKMEGEEVSVRGYINAFGDNTATIYQHADDMNGVTLRLENADPDVRRYIITKCERFSRTCRMTIKGKVALDNLGTAEIVVD